MTTEQSAHEFDVTVVLAVKDEAEYIDSALSSILSQVGVRLEVIVVDDGSTDDTRAIVERLAQQYRNLRAFVNPRRGKVSAFNLGVREGRGRFVCLFAGDDIMPPDSLRARFEQVRDLADDAPVIGLCKIRTMSALPKFDGQVVPRRRGVGALSGVSPLMNAPARDRIFPVPETLPNEDTWMEIAVLHSPGLRLVHSDIIGCFWRVHAGNSINFMARFDEYDRRITPRNSAFQLFLDTHGAELSAESRRLLSAKARCEQARRERSIVGVMTSGVNVVDRLRALAIVNPQLYAVRRTFWRVLSGW